MLRPVARESLSNQVFTQLRNKILQEEYQAGERLPSERVLCETLDVNRSSVREGLKRLEHARLITTRQGGGSTVLDFRTNAGFDLLRDLLAPGGRINPIAVRSMFEFGALNWPEMARLAAMRATDAELAELAELVDQIESCVVGDGAKLQDLDLQFFSVVARASENLALLLVMNSVRSVYDLYRQLFTPAYERRISDGIGVYRRIWRSMQKREAATAARLASQLLEQLAAGFGDQPPSETTKR